MRHHRTPARLPRLALAVALAFASAFTTAVAQDEPFDRADAIDAFISADATLNNLWPQVREITPEDAFETLLEEQRAWVEGRDDTAAYYAAVWTGTPADAVIDTGAYHRARAILTQQRNDILRAWLHTYRDRPAPRDTDDWTGVWIDGRGGILLLDEFDTDSESTFGFVINAARNPSGHSGSIAGIGERNETLGRFEQANKFDGGSAWVSFHFDPPYLHVHTANVRAYHGIRAYFHGRYIRFRELSDDDLDELYFYLTR